MSAPRTAVNVVCACSIYGIEYAGCCRTQHVFFADWCSSVVPEIDPQKLLPKLRPLTRDSLLGALVVTLYMSWLVV